VLLLRLAARPGLITGCAAVSSGCPPTPRQCLLKHRPHRTGRSEQARSTLEDAHTRDSSTAGGAARRRGPGDQLGPPGHCRGHHWRCLGGGGPGPGGCTGGEEVQGAQDGMAQGRSRWRWLWFPPLGPDHGTPFATNQLPVHSVHGLPVAAYPSQWPQFGGWLRDCELLLVVVPSGLQSKTPGSKQPSAVCCLSAKAATSSLLLWDWHIHLASSVVLQVHQAPSCLPYLGMSSRLQRWR